MFMNDFLKLGSSNKVVTGNVLNVAIECKKYGIKNILDSGVTINNCLHSNYIHRLNTYK